jgi:pyridoxamine 5'-phosphate oxidase
MFNTNDPIQLFAEWLEDAKKTTLPEPTAMLLATVSSDGNPSARVVLLKGFDERGFVFYSNLQSQKGRELQANPNAALCFYWPPLFRQVRIEGLAQQVSNEEADAYFATRPRGAQIGAWASQQSAELANREELEGRVKEFEEKFAGKEVSRPPFWSGYRVVPERIEFWQSREDRLHDRVVYFKKEGAWTRHLLYP